MDALFEYLKSRKLLKTDTFTVAEIKAACKTQSFNDASPTNAILRWLSDRGILSDRWTVVEITAMYAVFKQ